MGLTPAGADSFEKAPTLAQVFLVSDTFDVLAPELRSARLRLRRLSMEDAPAIHAYASDAEVTRFMLWPVSTSEEDARGLLANLTAPSVLAWAILFAEIPAVIGMVFLHSLSRQHRKAELAFNLSRSFWNRGLATEAARAVLAFAFNELNLNRIEATCMPGNGGSRRVLEKLGMSREGLMRQSHLRHDGFHDMELFSILRHPRNRPKDSLKPSDS